MRRRDLARRVERWRKLLAPEWRLTLKQSGPDWKDDEDYLATVQCDDDYHHAKLHFTDACLSQHPAEVDKTIVHELLHVLLRDYRHSFDLLKPQVSDQVWDAAGMAHDHAEEQFVERLARVVASTAHPNLPVIVYGTDSPE